MKQRNTKHQLTSTWKSSPAPSQSFDVITGVWICTKLLSCNELHLSDTFSLNMRWNVNVMKSITLKRQIKPYPEIRVNGSSGLAAYSEQWTEGVRSASQMRKLSDVLQWMVALDLKWKVLENKKRGVIICCLKCYLAISITKVICIQIFQHVKKKKKRKNNYHRITFSNHFNATGL